MSHARELNLDPGRIGATGGSAGGHLALLLAATEPDDGLEGSGGWPAESSAVQAAVSVVGPTDLRREFPEIVTQMLTDLVGAPPGQDDAGYAAASPAAYLSADDPPMLLIHGTRDELVPYEQATRFTAACEEAGVPARLVTIPNGGHGSGGDPRDWAAAQGEIVKFFDTHLREAPAR